MLKPKIPINEAERLKALRNLLVLDSPSEPSIDKLVQLAALITGCPISLISFVDANRQWFFSKHGIEAEETQRDVSFCGHAIENPHQTMIVRDATQDIRFQDNPLVTGAPFIQFYAGQPIVNEEGYALGTLCVIDRKSKELSQIQLDQLKLLSEIVFETLRVRKANLDKRDQSLLKGNRLAVIGHEIRTPLTSIIGYSQILKQESARPSPDFRFVAEKIQKVHDNSEHLLGVTRTLLDSARMGDQDIHPFVSKFELKRFVELTVDSFRPKAAARNLNLALIFDQKIPASCTTDKTIVRQVLSNVISNALKFTLKGGVKIHCRSMGEQIYFEVEDSGIGIAPELARKIFEGGLEPLVDTSKFESNRIGLNLSKLLIERVGGSLNLKQSIPDQGSTFLITLPREFQQLPPIDALDVLNSRAKVNTKSRNLLLVDDNEDNRELVKYFLSGYDVQITEARSTSEAEKRFMENLYDIVFLDMYFNDGTGFDVFKRIRKRKIETGARVFAFTASNDCSSLRQCLEYGFDGFISKPFTPDSIIKFFSKKTALPRV